MCPPCKHGLRFRPRRQPGHPTQYLCRAGCSTHSGRRRSPPLPCRPTRGDTPTERYQGTGRLLDCHPHGPQRSTATAPRTFRKHLRVVGIGRRRRMERPGGRDRTPVSWRAQKAYGIQQARTGANPAEGRAIGKRGAGAPFHAGAADLSLTPGIAEAGRPSVGGCQEVGRQKEG